MKARIGELETALADTQAMLEAERRQTAIEKHENTLLSGIIARDRERVRAEMAYAAWKLAEFGKH